MKRAFPLPLVIEDMGDGRRYASRLPFRWEHGPFSIDIESNEITDFASIPRLFWRLCPPMGLWNRAAYIHDYLYRTGIVSRWVADAIFYECLLDCGVNRTLATCMWLAVRLFGRGYYRRSVNL